MPYMTDYVCETCGKPFRGEKRKPPRTPRYCTRKCKPSPLPKPPEDVRQYIEARITRTERGCWEWTGMRDKDGYGVAKVNGIQGRAHRVSWSAHREPVPRGLWVLHHCDNPPCCNPDHLFVGNASDNNFDTHRKGRARDRRGENHYAAKLTAEIVATARADYASGRASCRALARRHGVHFMTMHEALVGKTWRHVA